jgi:hypothetical protein
MVYSNKFVMVVLVNGVPQKELANGTVPLPFGAEYSLRFRNKHNRRAVVKFYIDGENVSGNGYIINANSSVDIHRHHDKDARFKFVSLESADAVDFGKNGPNPEKIKGTIEARFQLEKERPRPVQIQNHHHHHHHYPRRTRKSPPPWINPTIQPFKPTWTFNSNTLKSDGTAQEYTTTGGGCEKDYSPSFPTFGDSDESMLSLHDDSKDRTVSLCGFGFSAPPPLQDGCTVEGTMSGQTFREVSIELEDDYVTLSVFLQGFTQEHQSVPVQAPSEAIYCDNCGAKRSKKTAKFCSNCGHKF